MGILRKQQFDWSVAAPARKLAQSFIYLFCMLGCVQHADAAAGQVEISHRTLPDGAIEFQVRGTDDRPSALVLNDVRTAKEMVRLSSFDLSETGNFYIARLPAGNPEGVYEVGLYDGNGRGIVFPRVPVAPPKAALNAVDVTIDRRKSLVSWVPGQTSLVRVNAGLDGGMFIRTLMPWHFSAAVENSMSWDFWDENHVIDYRGDPGLRVYAVPIPLPTHLVVIGHPLFRTYADLPLFSGLDVIEPEFGFVVSAPGGRNHAVDSLPGKEIPEISPGSAIRVKLDQAGEAALASKRFEILFFVNGQFFYEETDASDPYTLLWPSENFGEGFQLLTVNVKSYNIGYESRAIPIWITKSNQAQEQTRGEP